MSDSIEEFVPSPENIGGFEYAGIECRVYAGSRNATDGRHPRQWQFRYEPLFLPHVDRLGKLSIKVTNLGRRWQVQLPIALYTAETNKLAFGSVLKAYPKEVAVDLLPGNVTVLNLSSIQVQIDNLTTLSPTAQLSGSPIDLLAMSGSFSVDIYVLTEKDAVELADILPNLRLDYQISFAAKTIRTNETKISRSDVRSSKLYASLNGLGTTAVYVHRDDFRKLSEGINMKAAINAVIEQPDAFDATFAERVLSEFSQATKANAEAFDQEKWQATYNGDDLRPDVITKDLNKMFTKDITDEEWKYNGSLNLQGKASLIEILSAESTIDAKYSQEGLKKKLTERNIEVSFEGSKIVAKSILLNRINMSEFEGNSELTSVQAFVSNLRAPRSGNVQLALAAASGSVFLSLTGRLEELEAAASTHAPPGSILPYAGSVDDPGSIPQGWLSCGGQEVLRAEYPNLYKSIKDIFGAASSDQYFKLPSLNGRTIVGSGTYQDDTLGSLQRALGQTFGSSAYRLVFNQVPEHTHTVSGHTGQRDLTGYAETRQLPNTNGEGHQHSFSVASSARVATGALADPYPSTPPSLVLNFLIKF